MAEPLIITPQTIVVTGTSGSPDFLDLRLAIDISRWDVIDVSVGVLSISADLTFSLDFVTATQMDREDMSWDINAVGATNSKVGYLSAALTASGFKGRWFNLSLPQSGTATFLLNYLRWRAWVSTGTAMFTARAMCRRKGS